MKPAKPLITIFGGARCKPGAAEYRAALKLGRLLAKRGFTVVCGGYGGTMEAASRGAREAGGEIIGVTVELFRGRPNEFITQERRTPDLYRRLKHLIHKSAGYIALRGGMGTLVEVTLTLNQIGARILPPRPVVLLGDCWPPVLKAWKRHLAIEPRFLQCVRFAGSPAEAVGWLDKGVQQNTSRS
ncbi:MAG: LOG family protein [Verrucomicrobia bacterium]|nr:LOG family protein [Verrucomicrobiota bacterium]